MMSCEQVRPRLSAYAIEGLDARDKPEVEEHLAGCHRCSEALATIRSVESLATDAPLRPETANDLEERVFSYVQSYEAAEAASQAALGPEPPVDLERRSLERAGILTLPLRSTRHRVAAILAPAFAAAAAILSLMYMNASNDQGVNVASGAPTGHPMQTIELTGKAHDADLELVHFRHDNYRLVLHTAGLPGCRSGDYYELWLRGDDGEVSAGSFRVAWPDDIDFSFNVGIDPAEYYLVEVTREPVAGVTDKEGPVVMSGALDPSSVER